MKRSALINTHTGLPAPLRIAIDGRSLRTQRTGVGTYTMNLLENLLLDDSLRMTLFLDIATSQPQLPAAGRLKAIACRSPLGNNLLWSNVAVPARLRSDPADIFHSPGYTLPLDLAIPTVVSIHDVSYEARPQWYPHRRGVLRRMWYRLSAMRANRIITISEFSKLEIQKSYSIDPEKIRLIYPGVDRRLFRRAESQDDLVAFRKRHGIRGDFLLFVGDIHPRRNVARIIEALGQTNQSLRQDDRLELLIVGRFLDRTCGIEIQEIQHRRDDVRHLGYVAEEDLPMFYSLAKAFVFPSFYEGFGLGVLEAMACGCPVVVARQTACDEAAGDAGIKVDPWDVRSIAEAIASLIGNHDLARRCSELGLERARRFSWSAAAAETAKIYREVAGPPGQ